MSLERLTIVIPSYNRQRFISRQVEFWSKSPVRLVILDGSKDPIRYLKKINSKKIIYHHSQNSLEQRLKKSLNFINTDYVAMISDDEFFCKSSLKSCINFLDTHKDYSTCKGMAIGFNWDGNQVLAFKIYPKLEGYDNNNKSSFERMNFHMKNYEMASLWSIQRSEVYSSCINSVSKYSKYSSAAVAEIQFSLISSFMGKIKVIQNLMWLRSFENKNIWWNEGRLEIKDWWLDKKYSNEHKKFIDSIITFAKNDKNISPKETDVKNAINLYVFESKSYFFKFLIFIKKFIKKILLNNKDSIFVKFLLNIYPINSFKNKEIIQEPIETLAKKFNETEISEIKEIQEIISNFYNNKK
tara:strand:+ start:206 stop:1270 length:1065 start_codon:yes stop_codon:yes gene_type:complete